MKRNIFLIFFALVGVSTLMAQKNTALIGGNVGFTSIKDEFTNQTDRGIVFNPYVGYQFSDKMTVGVESSYTYAEKVTSTTKSSSSVNKIGGFLRYTQPLSDTFSFFGQLGAGYYNNAINNPTEEGWYASLTPNLFINFKNSFGLNFNIGGLEYQHTRNTSLIDFSFGKSVNVGISKNFAL